MVGAVPQAGIFFWWPSVTCEFASLDTDYGDYPKLYIYIDEIFY